MGGGGWGCGVVDVVVVVDVGDEFGHNFGVEWRSGGPGGWRFGDLDDLDLDYLDSDTHLKMNVLALFALLCAVVATLAQPATAGDFDAGDAICLVLGLVRA